MFAPRKGWRRGFEYLGLRMQRLPDTPSKIALGLACGIFTSFTPFFGLHFVVAAGLAWVLRCNVYASAVGTFFGNPLTFPFIMGISLKLGGWVVGHSAIVDEGFGDFSFLQKFIYLLQNIDDLVVPYLIGGIVPGLICAAGGYLLLRPLVATYQKRRRAKLMKRAKQRLKKHAAKRGPKTAPSTPREGAS